MNSPMCVITRSLREGLHRAIFAVIDIPSGARVRRENREFGERPKRAQRCEADDCRNKPLVKTGKARQSDDAKSEDRPDIID
jgi:hypothetical protein